MKYKNGKQCLPASLLQELQQYIQGELIYIPKKDAKRAGWGENNGTRRSIEIRNQEIYRKYVSGISTMELSQVYHLSTDSIRKIVVKIRSRVKQAAN